MYVCVYVFFCHVTTLPTPQSYVPMSKERTHKHTDIRYLGIGIHLLSHRWSSDVKFCFHSVVSVVVCVPLLCCFLYKKKVLSSEMNDYNSVVSGKKITTYWSIDNNHKNQTLNYLLWHWICIFFFLLLFFLSCHCRCHIQCILFLPLLFLWNFTTRCYGYSSLMYI